MCVRFKVAAEFFGNAREHMKPCIHYLGADTIPGNYGNIIFFIIITHFFTFNFGYKLKNR